MLSPMGSARARTARMPIRETARTTIERKNSKTQRCDVHAVIVTCSIHCARMCEEIIKFTLQLPVPIISRLQNR